MRLLSALLASAAAALAVNAAPNYEITKTAITIDKHTQALNNGDIVIRLHRTDDLFSDPTAFQDAKLLLEKNTHISLKIQLDPAAGTVNVNGEPLDIISSAHNPRVTAIRAEALRLPAHHNAPLMDAQTMKDLLAQMSPGIVGVEVKVESENIAPSVPVSSSSNEHDDDDTTSASHAITIRKVGLWIRVIEVEGQALPHATTTYTPILQLIVTGSGNKVDKIETLSINGDSPMEGAPGPMMIPSGMLPAKEEDAAKVIPVVGSAYRGNFRQSRPPHHAFHPVKKAGHPGFLAWLANLLGLSAPNPRIPFGLRGGGGRRGCKGMRLANATRIGKHLETHRPMLENPFSGTLDDSAEETTIPQEKQRHSLKPYYGYGRHFYSHHGHAQHHRHNGQGHHGRPCRIRAFFRNLGIGFVYGIALMATFFMHPYTLMSISGIAACALVFHVIRRIAGKRRTGRVALPDEEDVDDDDDEEEPLTDKEKQVLLESVMVVEERKSEDLPQYEEKSDQQRH